MNKGKKIAWTFAAVALIVIVTFCAAKSAIPPSGKVVYKYEYAGVEFEDDLTSEEVAAVQDIVRGKARHTMLISMPSCGWSWDIAIIINGTRYVLARDTCGTVFIGSELLPIGTFFYIDISNEEQDVLEEIFTSRGGIFPAI